MAILFVSHKYPPATGGMEKQSFELVEGMRAFETVHTLILGPKESRLMFFWSLERRIVQLLEQYPDIEVVHFNDALIGAVALGHTKYRHVKRMVTVHGLDVVFPNKWYQERIFPKFAGYDKLIAVSQATAKACRDRGMRADVVEVIPNGVAHDIAEMPLQKSKADLAIQYGFNVEKPYLVAMGRAVKRKGFSWFVREVLPGLTHDAQLIIIGPFAPQPSLVERILTLLPASFANQIYLMLGFPTDQAALRSLLKTEQRVQHLGRLPFDDLVAVLKHANAFVMPNITVRGDMEGFGLVCLEAALAQVPVFAAGIEGITDAIQDGKNGILLPSEQSLIWQQALNACLLEPMMYKQKAVEFQRFTRENYSWELMVKRYATCFRS
jgi:glycosyltransferase involved in cell wall biosynthesis